MARTFNIILQVELEPSEVPENEQDWNAWGKIAQDEARFGEVYDVVEVDN